MNRQLVLGIVAVIGLMLVGVVWLPGLLRRAEKPEPPAVLQQRVVEGASPQERAAAAAALTRQGAAARQEIRQSLAANHAAPREVRIRLLQGTMYNRDWRSMPEVFRAMEDPDPKIRARAATAAREIMGCDFHFRAQDPPEKRAQVLHAMRREFEQMIPNYRKAYADQEESP